MTDPLEDRLRSHLADRASQVTATPDPTVFVERSTGRLRIGAPLVAGVAAVVALLVGGSFATGWSVAASSPTTTTTLPGASGAAAPTAHPTALAPGAAGADVSGTGAAVVAPLTSLFTRTTDSGVTIRIYTSTAVADGGCSPSSTCPPIGSVPGAVRCPKGAMCAQPVTTPTASTASTPPGVPGSSGGSTGGTASGTGGGTATTVPASATGCQQLTLELSTAAAVGTATLAAPTDAGLGPKTVEVVDSGSFGEAEGGPVGWVAVVVSGDVTSVRLLSSTGAVLDAMTPSSGVAVLVASGGSALAGTSVVGVDATGTALATVATDGGSSAVGPGCTPVVPMPPTTTPPTTVPPPTVPSPTTTSPAPGPPTTTIVPGPITPTIVSGPITPTVVPPTAVPNVVPIAVAATGSA